MFSRNPSSILKVLVASVTLAVIVAASGLGPDAAVANQAGGLSLAPGLPENWLATLGPLNGDAYTINGLDTTTAKLVVDASAEGLLRTSEAGLSPDGTLIAYKAHVDDSGAGNDARIRVRSTDGLGTYTEIHSDDRFTGFPSFSPDSTQIVHTCYNQSHLCLSNPAGPDVSDPTTKPNSIFNAATIGASFLAEAIWSPSGDSLIFRAYVGGYKIFRINFDGASWVVEPSPILSTSWPVFPKWSPDESHIAYGQRDATGNFGELMLADVAPDGTVDETNATLLTTFTGSATTAVPMGFITNEFLMVNQTFSGQPGRYWLVNVNDHSLTEVTSSGWPDGLWSALSAIPIAPSQPGDQIVYHTNRDGNFDIWVMNEDGSGQSQITSDAGADFTPSVSPDGTRVTFVSRRVGGKEQVFLMNVDGTDQQLLTTADGVQYNGNPSWCGDSRIIHGHLPNFGPPWDLAIMDDDGSNSSLIWPNNGVFNTTPICSSDGQRFAVDAGSGITWVADVDGSNQSTLVNLNWSVPTDWLSDGSKLLIGCRTSVQNDICVVNADGTGLVNLTNNVSGIHDGAAEWSPDETKIAFNRFAGTSTQVWTMNADGTGQTQLTFSGDNGDPSWVSGTTPTEPPVEVVVSGPANIAEGDSWGGTVEFNLPEPVDVEVDWGDGTTTEYQNVISPLPVSHVYVDDNPTSTSADPYEIIATVQTGSDSGERIIFVTGRHGAGNNELYWVNPDGTGEQRILGTTAVHEYGPAISQDGTQLAYTSLAGGNPDIYVADITGAGLANVTRITNHAGDDTDAAWSPDGTRIAFSSNRSGNYDVWVKDLSDASPPEQFTFTGGWDSRPTWSADGNYIAFDCQPFPADICVLDVATKVVVDEFDHQVGASNYLNPTWSPNDDKIAFMVDFLGGNTEIYVADAVDGGNQTNLTNLSSFDSDPNWSPDGTKLTFFSNRDGNSEIYVIDVQTKIVERVTINAEEDGQSDWGIIPALADGSTAESIPLVVTANNVAPVVDLTVDQLSIDEGDTVIGTVTWTDVGIEDTHTVSFDCGDSSVVPVSISELSGSATFSCTYLDDNPSGTSSDPYTISASVEDDDLGVGTDEAIVTVSNVAPGQSAPEILFSTRDDEVWPTMNWDIWVMDADGLNQNFITSREAVDEEYPAWSPNGSEIAFNLYSGGGPNWDLAVMTDEGADRDNITVSNSGEDVNAAWSPDGKEIAFHSKRAGSNDYDIYVMDAKGNHEDARHLTTKGGWQGNATWSPDGLSIAFADQDGDIWVMNADDGSDLRNLTGTPGWPENDPDWSPDGSKIAFSSKEHGNWEIYVMDADDGSNQTRFTTATGNDYDPSWAPDSNRLAFVATRDGGKSDIWVMDVVDTDNNGHTDHEENLTKNSSVQQAMPDWKPNTSVLLELDADVIDEGDTVTGTVTWTDVGVEDTHTVSFDCGDIGVVPVEISQSAGSATFSCTYLDDDPSGTSSDPYTISASVEDDDLGVGTDEAIVTVNNVAPVVDLAVDQLSIDEGDMATGTVTWSDVGVEDTHTVSFDCGDIGVLPVEISQSAGSATFSCTYLDDDPSGTSFDAKLISTSVTDDDLGVGTDELVVTVNNVVPVITVVGDVIDEGETATVSGTISDPGVEDTFTVTIDWGDGLALDVLILPAGSTSYSSTRPFADDDPTGTSSDVYPVSVTVVDDDGGVSAGSAGLGDWEDILNSLQAPRPYSPAVLTDDYVYVGGGGVNSQGLPHQSSVESAEIDSQGNLGTWAYTPSLQQARSGHAGASWKGTLSDEWYVIYGGGQAGDHDRLRTIEWARETGGTLTPFVYANEWLPNSPNPGDGITGLALIVHNECMYAIGGSFPSSSNLNVYSTVLNEQLVGGNYEMNLSGWTQLTGAELPQPWSFVQATQSDEYVYVGVNFQSSPMLRARFGAGCTLVIDPIDGAWLPTGDGFVDSHRFTGVTIANGRMYVAGGSPADLGGDPNKRSFEVRSAPVIAGGDIGAWEAEPRMILERENGYIANIGPYLYAFGGQKPWSHDPRRMVERALLPSGAATTVTVNNVAPVVDLAVDQLSIDEGDTVTGTVTWSDVGVEDTHTVSFDCGDSGVVPVEISQSAGSATFSCTYPDDDPSGTSSDLYTISASVEDDDLGVGTDEVIVTVNNVAPLVDLAIDQLSIDEGGQVTGIVTFGDPGTDTHTAVINWGDGTGDQDLGSVTSPFLVSHPYLDDNPTGTAFDINTVTVTVTDDDLGVGANSEDVTVNNVAPVVETIDCPIDPQLVGTAITCTGSFSDIGTLDTHSAEFFWIDSDNIVGPPVAGVIVGNSVSGTYTPSLPDIYTVKLVVTDDDALAGELVFEFVVVYNPAGGFATGNGTIIPGLVGNSDSDDLLPGIDGASNAKFGFVVKYTNGQSQVPGGQLKFRYKAGDFKLESLDYEWLVVTNNSWAKFQGTATIEGMPGVFTFKVEARDSNNGQPDRFVITIWAPDDDPDLHGRLFKASGDLVRGKITVHQ